MPEASGWGERVAYRDAGAAMRQAMERAVAARVTLKQWRVLAAVLTLTASYSRLGDTIPLARLARMAAVEKRDAARALKALEAAGVLVYRSGGGRGNYGFVALLPAERAGGNAHLSAPGKGGRSARERAGDPTPERWADRTPHYYEKTDREEDEELLLARRGAARVEEGSLAWQLMWHALIAECGEPETQSERGSYAKATKELLNAVPPATPDEVAVRADAFRCIWHMAELTPNALAKHWGLLGRTADWLPPPAAAPAPAALSEAVVDQTPAEAAAAHRALLERNADDIAAAGIYCWCVPPVKPGTLCPTCHFWRRGGGK